MTSKLSTFSLVLFKASQNKDLCENELAVRIFVSPHKINLRYGSQNGMIGDTLQNYFTLLDLHYS